MSFIESKNELKNDINRVVNDVVLLIYEVGALIYYVNDWPWEILKCSQNSGPVISDIASKKSLWSDMGACGVDSSVSSSKMDQSGLQIVQIK